MYRRPEYSFTSSKYTLTDPEMTRSRFHSASKGSSAPRSYSAMRKTPSANRGDIYSSSIMAPYPPVRYRKTEYVPLSITYSSVSPGTSYGLTKLENRQTQEYQREKESDFYQRPNDFNQRKSEFLQKTNGFGPTKREPKERQVYADGRHPQSSYSTYTSGPFYQMQANGHGYSRDSRPRDFLEREPRPEPERRHRKSKDYNRVSSVPPSRFLAETDNDMDCIIPPVGGIRGVYVGNLEAARDIRLLKSHNISAVLTAAYGTGVSYTSSQVQIHRVIPADDIETFNLSVYFQEAIEFLEDTRDVTNVLVHCFAGMSRSATLVIAYLIYKNNWPLGKAVSYCQSKRPIIQPNPGFMRQLKKFEREHFARKALENEGEPKPRRSIHLF